MRSLQLFAFQTYKQYKENPQAFIELKPQQLKKLKMITIAEMASKDKFLKYTNLTNELDIKDLRELEDLMIDCIYNELLKGKLDQKNHILQVEFTYGRDARAEDFDSMIAKLEDWDK